MAQVMKLVEHLDDEVTITSSQIDDLVLGLPCNVLYQMYKHISKVHPKLELHVNKNGSVADSMRDLTSLFLQRRFGLF